MTQDDETPPPPRVAVLLDADPYDVGEWLADATAFEAAGVDELWLRYDDESPLDPCTLCAALAAVTHRARLVLHPAGDASPRTLASLDQLGRGRFAVADDAEAGRWFIIPSPSSRAEWRDTLAAAAERGAHGILAPDGPRLLDILRNPDEPGERHDLQLTVG
jgi:hypothetical protein